MSRWGTVLNVRKSRPGRILWASVSLTDPYREAKSQKVLWRMADLQLVVYISIKGVFHESTGVEEEAGESKVGNLWDLVPRQNRETHTPFPSAGPGR